MGHVIRLAIRSAQGIDAFEFGGLVFVERIEHMCAMSRFQYPHIDETAGWNGTGLTLFGAVETEGHKIEIWIDFHRFRRAIVPGCVDSLNVLAYSFFDGPLIAIPLVAGIGPFLNIPAEFIEGGFFPDSWNGGWGGGSTYRRSSASGRRWFRFFSRFELFFEFFVFPREFSNARDLGGGRDIFRRFMANLRAPLRISWRFLIGWYFPCTFFRRFAKRCGPMIRD